MGGPRLAVLNDRHGSPRECLGGLATTAILHNARKRANKNDDASRRYICHIIISDRKIHLRHSLYDTAGVPQWTSYKCNLTEAQNNKLGGYLSPKGTVSRQ